MTLKSRASAVVNTASIVAHFTRTRWRWHHLHAGDLVGYQDRRARQIVSYTAQHSPFYRDHWSGYDLQDWRTLPTVDKQAMMDNFSTFTTRNISKESAMQVALQAERSRDFSPLLDGLTVGLSSGTSGHRGLFVASPGEQAAWAGTILARTLHDLRPRRLRVAFFLRSNNNLYEQVGNGLIQFRYFDLMMPLAEAVGELNTLQPHILIGPPSLVGLLAGEHEAGRLRIHPERLISVAEVLEAQDQARLHATFNVPVHQIYQCTEGFLAASCARGTLHIQEDIVALQFEPGAADGRVTPIVTDLWRRTQPIIRYRLNDVLQLDPTPCLCGSPFRAIRAIEGRSDDICYFESHTGQLRPFFPDTIRRMILLASPAIADYQAIQTRCGHINIHLSLTPGASFEAVRQSVQVSVTATITQYDCLPAIMQIVEGLPPLLAGTKRRRIQNLPDLTL